VITIVGILVTKVGLTHRQELTADKWTFRTRSWACSSLQLHHKQPARIELNIDHDRDNLIGEIVALYRPRNGDCWAVAEAPKSDHLLDFDQPIY
jgi:hypothetical protein